MTGVQTCALPIYGGGGSRGFIGIISRAIGCGSDRIATSVTVHPAPCINPRASSTCSAIDIDDTIGTCHTIGFYDFVGICDDVG